ncbi:PKD domain-containing protein [Maribacter ulvicola]|uniref:PKD domain-containing protein n=1 Tax=Maribacter ulvicola TaxID=228959 RepID=A0A1N6WNR6_9FLAO|nr:PKD domain-containing protein [Maribacter ulvicola]SIQ91695.1 PKD domain-containing protein [Maribacter ulvicola]
MKKIKTCYLFILGILFLQCSNDEEVPMVLADFQFLVEDTQVTFNGTVANADSITWDFGDGGSSTEEDPVYSYTKAGTFDVVMSVNGANGSFSETKQVTISPSFDLLLTGGSAKPDGKSWRLKKAYTAGKEGAGPIDDGLGILLPSFDNLLDAVGLGSSYNDTFTFVFDGTYKVDNKDGQSLMGIIYASIFEGQHITAVSADVNNVPLATVLYTPVTNATWELYEDDFTIDAATGAVQFTEKRQLILGEYLGFKDYSNVVILKEINETTMNVALGIHTEPSVFDKPTLFLHLTFEAL